MAFALAVRAAETDNRFAVLADLPGKNAFFCFVGLFPKNLRDLRVAEVEEVIYVPEQPLISAHVAFYALL